MQLHDCTSLSSIIVFYHSTCIVNKSSYREIQYYFRINILPTLFYIQTDIFLALFQRKERVSVVTLKVQSTVPFKV